MLRTCAIVLAAAICIAAVDPDPREAKFRQQMQLDPTAEVQYFDEAGRKLEFAEFFKMVVSGRSFGLEHSDKKSAVVRLDAPKAAAPKQAAAYKLGVGDAFPAFKLGNLAGRPVSNAALAGKYTLVNFFFADCTPCIAEVPSLNAFASSHPETRVLAVTFDDAKVAREFVAQRSFRWPILAEGQSLADALGVTVYPTLVLVDPNGRIAGIAPSMEIASPKRLLDEASLSAWVARRRTQ